MSVTRRLLSVALAPLIFSLIGGVACYASAGPSLGLFLGGLIIVTLLVPPLTLSESPTANRLIILGSIILPLCAIWLFATFLSVPEQRPRISEWLAACAILIAYAIALAGLSATLRLTTRSAIPSAALTVIIGLAWLTWPIWASSTWSGGASETAVARGIAIHPAVAINGQLSRPLGNWTEQSLAYHLTELGQSVNFILPQSAWPCILLHGLIGAALMILAHWLSTPGQNCEATSSAVPDSSDPRITTD
jgi:hypothetical protein